jgi:hypothetical protein
VVLRGVSDCLEQKIFPLRNGSWSTQWGSKFNEYSGNKKETSETFHEKILIFFGEVQNSNGLRHWTFLRGKGGNSVYSRRLADNKKMETGCGIRTLHVLTDPVVFVWRIICIIRIIIYLFVTLCRNHHYKYDKCITYYKNYVCIL